MTRLLVSVRDAAEASIALTAGADLIDIKEPAKGSLGAASVETVREIIAAVGGRVPVSAALGELLEGSGVGNALPKTGLAYAKFGLAGCDPVSDWRDRWSRALTQLPRHIQPVAVAYADWRQAQAPRPAAVLAEARLNGCQAVLIDTFDKARGDLFNHATDSELADFLQSARGAELLVVLAGSLSVMTIPRALALAPDYVAVRGAACIGSRRGSIDAVKITALRKLVFASRNA